MNQSQLPHDGYHATRYIPMGFSIYEGTPHFTLDHFNEEFKKIFDGYIYLRGKRFIAPYDCLIESFIFTNQFGQCFLGEQQQIELIEHQILTENRLICGRLPKLALRTSKVIGIEHFQYFLKKLIHLFYDFLLSTIHIIKKHFTSREIENQKMINHAVIRHQLAEVYINMQYGQYLLNDGIFTQAIQLAQQLLSQLGKLAGGRAFLTNNIHEMQALIFIFSQIYFSETKYDR